MINKQRYGIRKYKIGAASIALGTIVAIGISENNEAQASEINAEQNVNNESQESQDQTNVDIQQQSAPLEMKNEIHVDTQQQPKEQQTSQQQEESFQSEEITKTTESSNQNIENNTSTQEVENKEKVVAPAPTTLTNEQPKAIPAPKTSNTQKILKQSEQLQRVALQESNSLANDVSSAVEVKSGKIKTHTDSNKVNPHQAERVTLEYDLKIGSNIKKDDYFDIKLSDNVDTIGIGTKKIMPEIKEGDVVIATGVIIDNGNIRYTFTDFINKVDFVNATLSINLFFKPSVVLNNGKQTVTSTIGKEETKSEFDIEYLDGKVNKNNININGRIDRVNKEESTITQITYINTSKVKMDKIAITGKLTKGSIEENNNPVIKIYEYNGNGVPSQSININENDKDFVDVTDTHKNIIHLYENGTYVLLFDFATSKTYVIKYEGKYDNKVSDLNFQTQLVDNLNYDSSLIQWNNGVEFYKNNANGKGILNPIIGTGPDIKIDFELPNVNGKDKDIVIESSKETKPSDEYFDTVNKIFNNNHVVETDDISDITGGEINQNNNVVVIEDVTDPTGGKIDYNSDHVELDENSNPGGGRIDYNSDHVELDENSNPGGGKLDYNSNPIDLEEDSNPGGGKVDYNTNIIDIDEDTNFGEEDIYHNTDLIDFDEDTATGIVTGAITDHTTIEDTMEYTKDNNLIELVDDNTLPPAITGEAEGPVIEIDDNHQVEIIVITMPVGEEGSIKGKVEETTENKLINFEEETGTGEIRGEVTGSIEEIDEKNEINIIDVTMPIGEAGHIKGIVDETTEINDIHFEDETGTGEIRGEVTGSIEEINENNDVEIINITMPIGEEGNVKGIVEETTESIDIDFEEETGNGNVTGNVSGIIEEIDENHIVESDESLESENGSVDNDILVEVNESDASSNDNGSEMPIIIENTVPKNNGSVKGVTDEADTSKVVPPTVKKSDKDVSSLIPSQSDKKQDNNHSEIKVSKDRNDVTIPSDKKIEDMMAVQDCDTRRTCVVTKKPTFKAIDALSNTSTASVQKEQQQHNALPQTGNKDHGQGVLFGGLLSLLGLSLFRRKNEKSMD